MGIDIGGLLFVHAESGEEIYDINFPAMHYRPVPGDEIHYWQDGTEDAPGGGAAVRRDFLVRNVHHDLRYAPPRGGVGKPHWNHSIVVSVEEVEKPD